MAGNPLLNLAGGRRPPPSPGEDPTDLPPMQAGPKGPPKGPPMGMKGPPPGPPPGAEGPGEPEGPGNEPGPPDKMPTSPEEAIGVLQDFGITPDDFPMVKAAVDLVSDAMDGGQDKPGPTDAGPPPGGPPPSGA